MANNAEYFRSFSMYSDVLEAVSECVSTSLADKTSLGDAEKLENNCVCRGISEPISKANGFYVKQQKDAYFPYTPFLQGFSSVFILLWFPLTVFLRLSLPRLPLGLLRLLRLLPELGQNRRLHPNNPLHRKLPLFRGIHL